MEKQVKSKNVHKIVEILGKDPVLVEGRERFHGALGLLPGTLPDIKREYLSDTPGFLAKSLHLWISNFGKDATFGRLIEILEKGGFKNSAGELTEDALYSDQFDSVEGVSGETGNHGATGLFFEIPEHTLNFTGREQELSDLHNTVMNGKRVVTLLGMGGIGKTTLAAQYVWKYHEGVFSNVTWIKAENTASLKGSFSRLANELRLMKSENNPNTDEFKKIVADVYKKLTSSKSLFVFDNAVSREEIHPYLPRLNLKTTPKVLITTRNNKWNDKFKIIQLGLFKPEEALKFFENYLGLTSPEEFSTAEKLCKELGYLPIAVRQAGAYIKEDRKKGISHNSTQRILEEYVNQIEKDCSLLDYAYWKTTGEANRKTTFNTWNITMEMIKKENEMRERILEFIAYIDPDAIPIEILEKLVGRTDRGESSIINNMSNTQIIAAINLLNQYSIIKKEGGYIYVHRLVQKVIRWKNREQEKVLLTKAINILVSFEVYDEHCLSLWKYALEHEEVVKEFPAFGIRTCASLIFYSSGNEEQADIVLKVIKKTIEKFKTVHPYKISYRLAVMCLEIQLRCGYSFLNVDKISELVKEILSNSKEFIIGVEAHFANLIRNTAKYLLKITEGLEYKYEFMKLACEFYKTFFNVIMVHTESLGNIDCCNFDNHNSYYIKLMVWSDKTEEIVEMMREFVEIHRLRIGSARHLFILRSLADNLIDFDGTWVPDEELIKYSLELNEELYNISLSRRDYYNVQRTLLHKAFCLFLLGDAGSKEEGLKICETIVQNSNNDFVYRLLFRPTFIPVSCMLVEFGYHGLALKFFELMRKHGKSQIVFNKFESYYFEHILKKLELEISPEEEYQERLNQIIIILGKRIAKARM